MFGGRWWWEGVSESREKREPLLGLDCLWRVGHPGAFGHRSCAARKDEPGRWDLMGCNLRFGGAGLELSIYLPGLCAAARVSQSSSLCMTPN